MQRMDAHVKQIAILIYKSQCLLLFSVMVDDFQTVETSDTVVDMSDVIARFQIILLFDCQCLTTCKNFTEMEAVITLKNLMVGEAAQPLVVVDKTRLDGI